jgi:raffinose/stachyose/melibiose transport system permease protein/xylobiose transport system permease protein
MARGSRPAPAAKHTPSASRGAGLLSRINIPAGLASVIWLAVVALPVYYILMTTLRGEDEYLTDGALPLPSGLNFDAYQRAWDLGFGDFMVNSVIVTLVTVVLVLLVALPASYAIVRNTSRPVQSAFSVFLLGLAIPAQAVIIPIYLIITRMQLYDSLTAVILPTAAFSIPLSIVVLTSTLRDIPGELYEAMIVDGAGTRRIFARLVVPLARPGMVTIGIFSGLNAWNGFLFPLVLTQSADQAVLPLSLQKFQNQYGTDFPGLMAAVVLSVLPVLALSVFGRRYLLRGLSAGFGK